MTKPPMFQMGADTRFLCQRLAKMQPGDFISYAALGEEIGRIVVGGTPALQSARRALLKSDNILFAPVKGEGLRRMNDDNIVDDLGNHRRRARRAARRGVRAGVCVSNFGALDPQRQMAYVTNMSVMAMMAETSSDKSAAKIEMAAAGRSSELPIAQTLKAFLT